MMVRPSPVELSLTGFRGDSFSAATSVGGRSRQQPLKFVERRTDANGALVKDELADGALVGSAALLHDGDSLTNSPSALEIAEQQYRVGEIADIDRRVGRANEAVLSERKQRGDALLS